MLQTDLIPQISQLETQSHTYSMSSTHISCKLSPSSKMCRRKRHAQNLEYQKLISHLKTEKHHSSTYSRHDILKRKLYFESRPFTNTFLTLPVSPTRPSHNAPSTGPRGHHLKVA